MREIKFRAWNKETKTMIDLHTTTPLALSAEMNTQMAMQGFGGLFIPFHKDLILMQFTGLKDKNGKEIYEGDKWLCGSFTGIVIFRYCKWEFATAPESKCISYPSFYRRAEDGEIIGNIHENPELTNEETTKPTDPS